MKWIEKEKDGTTNRKKDRQTNNQINRRRVQRKLGSLSRDLMVARAEGITIRIDK